MTLEITCKSDVNLIHHLKTYHNHFPFISASLKCPAACSLFILFSVNGALAVLTQAWSENQSVISLKPSTLPSSSKFITLSVAPFLYLSKTSLKSTFSCTHTASYF